MIRIARHLLIMTLFSLSMANPVNDIVSGIKDIVGADKVSHWEGGLIMAVVFRDALNMSWDQTIEYGLAAGIIKGIGDYYLGGTVDIMDLAAQLAGMGFKFCCEIIGSPEDTDG